MSYFVWISTVKIYIWYDVDVVRTCWVIGVGEVRRGRGVVLGVFMSKGP